MTEAERFLELAAYQLIRQEGVRVVKTPAAVEDGLPWTPGWEDWDQVLVGEGPGIQPTVIAFRHGAGLDVGAAESLYESLVRRVLSTPGGQRQSSPMLAVRVIACFYFDSVEPSIARKMAGIVPDRYYAGLKPQVWVVDLSRARLWAPKTLGVLPTRAQSAVGTALMQAARGEAVGGREIAQAEQVVTSERTQFVSRLRGNVPYVTYALLAAIYVVFVLEWLDSSGRLGARVLLRFGALQPVLVEHGQYWRLFGAMFVHVSVLHILFNSIALYSVGTLVERIYGHLRYALIYFVSGIFASVASYVSMLALGQPHEIAAGASGAIFGIAGVLIVLGVLRQSIVPRAIALQLSIFMLLLIVLNLVFDAFTPQIDIRAHVGGLVVGLVMGYLLAPKVRTQEPEVGTAKPEALGG